MGAHYTFTVINIRCIHIGVGWEKISPGHTFFLFDNSRTWTSILISIKISEIYNKIKFQLIKLSTK